MNLMTN